MIIHITDDAERYVSPKNTVDEAIAEYAATYGFIEPGIVQCALYGYDADEEPEDLHDYDVYETFSLTCVSGKRGTVDS